MTARQTGTNEIAFWANYCACLSQIIVFLLYAWARSHTAKKQQELNFVQLALITATFLIGASVSNVLFIESPKSPSPEALRYSTVSAGLYLLWLFLLIIWIKHLKKLIIINIPQATKSRKSNNKSDLKKFNLKI